MRVLICGDRNWTDRPRSTHTSAVCLLAVSVAVRRSAWGCFFAGQYAREHGFKVIEGSSADWKQYGRAAGPIG